MLWAGTGIHVKPDIMQGKFARDMLGSPHSSFFIFLSLHVEACCEIIFFISFIIKFWILLNGKRIGHALFVMFKVPSHGGTLSTYKQNQIYLKYE